MYLWISVLLIVWRAERSAVCGGNMRSCSELAQHSDPTRLFQVTGPNRSLIAETPSSQNIWVLYMDVHAYRRQSRYVQSITCAYE